MSVSHHSAILCHIGAISMRTGYPLLWEPETERFHGPHSDEANTMIAREMRSSWKLEV